MTFLKLLLSGALIYIVAMVTAIPTDENLEIVRRSEFNYSLTDYILPLHYKMELELLFNNIFVGKCTISIYIIFATQHITLHAPGLMNIMAPELKRINSGEIYKVNSLYFNQDDNFVLDFGDMLSPGFYTLYVPFSNDINTNFFKTLYINQEGHTVWLLATGIQPRKKQIFPSWDKPELRITFNISIRHYRKYRALSNMPIQKYTYTNNDDELMWTSFHSTSLISTDNVAFVLSNLNRITNLYETISMWCRPQLVPHVKFALSIIENVTMYLENYWNKSKRVLEWTLPSSEWKVDHIAIPNFQDELKQTIGFVFYREADIIYNEELDPVAHKMIIARLVTREMAKKYIGNLLKPSYRFHLWLNEGFIMFLQTYIMDKALPDFRMMDLFVVQIQHDILDLNTYFVKNSTIEYNNYPESYLHSSFSYIKGSIIWRMLERTMLPDVFLKGINRYLNNQFRYPKATASDDLWAAMQTVISASDPKYQFDVKRMVDLWAMQNCFPVLEVMRNYSSDVVTMSVQFHDELDEEQYYIPVTFTTESDPNFSKTWSDVWLTPSYSKIEFFLKKDQWIIVNLQQAGYYRVSYDTENWRRIAHYLNSARYSNIHVLNRAQIIDDAFHFAIEKKLNFSLFWELANYLSEETDYIAWYPMFKALEFISNIFAFVEFFSEFFSEFQEVQKSLGFINTTYSKIVTPMYNKDNHTGTLEQELAKWECIIDRIICPGKANLQLQWHLEDPKERKLSPGWKKWTYCNGLKWADNVTWNKVLHLYEEKFDATILEYLTCSINRNIIINYLEITLEKIISMHMSYYRPEQGIERLLARESAYAVTANVFLSILARNTRYILKDILRNFKKIKHKRVSEIMALTVIINNIYTKEQLDEINKFVKKEMKNLISDVESKIETRFSEIEKQTEYLHSLFM